MFALEGVTLVDFGQYLAGPFGPMILGDLGADVIKVEPVTGDGMRMATKPFFGCQRGKRDIALNIKTPEGLEIAQKLITKADIVHHNMTRGVATKLGIDYPSCRALRDDIVYCNTYAYGLAEPLGKFGGLDPLYQAAAGLEYEAGATHEGNTPLYYRFGMCDASNALLSIVGVLMALFHRQRTGEGQELWTSLLDGGVVFSSDVFLIDGKPWDRPRLDRDLTGLSALYRLYRTQDDDWIMVAAVKDAEWEALCRVLHVEHLLTEARFATAASRHVHRRQLASLLEPVFRTKTARYWSRNLDDADVPNEVPIDTWDGEQVLYDADNERLGLVTEYVHPLVGVMRQFGDLIRFSETPGHVHGPPPLVGQDTREIMRELGYRDGDIDALNASNVVYVADAAYLTRFTNERVAFAVPLRLLAPASEVRFVGPMAMPAELYFLARQPVPLAGMAYPSRVDWAALHDEGLRHVVCLTHDAAPYDPSPLTVTAISLQDLYTGVVPDDPDTELLRIARAAHVVVDSIEAGNGVSVHCRGGRGRAGTVLGTALVMLGHDPDDAVAYLDRIHTIRGKGGWPESAWQSDAVRSFGA